MWNRRETIAKDTELSEHYDTLDGFIEEQSNNPEFAALLNDARIRRELIAALVTYRKQSKLTQKVVAQTLELSSATVSEFENQAEDPRLSTLQRYARAVGCELNVSIRPVFIEESVDTVGIPLVYTSRSIGRELQVETLGATRATPSSWAAADSKRTDFATAA